MAGAGFDAAMIHDADGALKDRFGRVAYVWTRLGEPAREAVRGEDHGRRRDLVQGQGELHPGRQRRRALRRHRGRSSDAEPDDGRLELGVVTADGVVAVGAGRSRAPRPVSPERSPFVRVTNGRTWSTSSSTARCCYELDGGDRTKVEGVQGRGRARRGQRLRSRTVPEVMGFSRPEQLCPDRQRGSSSSVSQASDTASSAKAAGKAAGNDVVNSRAFEVLSRAGFVARGVVYGIIGLLAFDLAIGQGGKITNQQGALRTVAHQPFGHVLSGRSSRSGSAATPSGGSFAPRLGHGPEGATAASTASRRFGERARLRRCCASSPSRSLMGIGQWSSGNAKKTTGDVFGWPGRPLDRRDRRSRDDRRRRSTRATAGVHQKFLDDSKTEADVAAR